jgi:hypothetical protein
LAGGGNSSKEAVDPKLRNTSMNNIINSNLATNNNNLNTNMRTTIHSSNRFSSNRKSIEHQGAININLNNNKNIIHENDRKGTPDDATAALNSGNNNGINNNGSGLAELKNSGLLRT